MTPDEFDAQPPGAFDARFRYELIRGVLVVTPPPGNAEVGPNEYLGYLLLTHQETHPQGALVDASLPGQTLRVGENRRRCDRAIWTGLGRTPDPEADVPAIVVEFVSLSRRDRRRDYEEKLREYLAIGVQEYWVIDRFRRVMVVYRKRSRRVVERVTKESEAYETDLLPGFKLPLGVILARADLWRAAKRRRPPAGGGS